MARAKGPSWKLRRRAVFGTLIFAGLLIVYVAIRWDENELGQTLVLSMSGLMASIIASYTGFAVWEDTKLYRPQREEPTDE